MNYESGFASLVGKDSIVERLNHVDQVDISTGMDMEYIVKRHIKKYPVMSDTYRAKLLGCSKMTTQKWRSVHGIPPMTEKRCGQCGEVRSVNAFANEMDPIDPETADGYKPICKRCSNHPEIWWQEIERLKKGAGW